MPGLVTFASTRLDVPFSPLLTRTNSLSLIHVGSLKFESLYKVVALPDSRSRT